jgi:hypothetical protein
MKELGMSWNEIKITPRHELTGLLIALSNYNLIHQFDGYDSDDIGRMAKDKPKLRTDYGRSIAMKERMERRAGSKPKQQSFKELLT